MARAFVTDHQVSEGTTIRFGVTFFGPGVTAQTDFDFVQVDVAGLLTAAALESALDAAVKAKAAQLGYALSPPGTAVIAPRFGLL